MKRTLFWLWHACLPILAAITIQHIDQDRGSAVESGPSVVTAQDYRRSVEVPDLGSSSSGPLISWDDDDIDGSVESLPPATLRSGRPSDPSSLAERKPLGAIDFEEIYSTLDRGPGQRGTTSASWSVDRDPYWGTQDRITVAWEARNLAHRTLYFDDLPAERWGIVHVPPWQPVASLCEFIRDGLLFPLRWPCDRPHDLHYVLGLERPGTCAPFVRERLGMTR